MTKSGTVLACIGWFMIGVIQALAVSFLLGFATGAILFAVDRQNKIFTYPQDCGIGLSVITLGLAIFPIPLLTYLNQQASRRFSYAAGYAISSACVIGSILFYLHYYYWNGVI